PVLVLSGEYCQRYLASLEPGAPRVSAMEKRIAMMLGLRLRRERAIILLHAESAPADGVGAIAQAATAAPWRVALTRFPTRGDGLDMILRGWFGPTEQS